MKYVLVDPGKGTAHDIVDASGRFPTHPSLVWVPAPDAVKPDWRLEGGEVRPPSPEAEADTRIERVKAVAGQVILKRIPLWQQSNYNARMNELNDLRIAGGTLTREQLEEIESMRTLWEWVKSVRLTSDLEESSDIAVEDIVWPVAP